MADNQVCEAVGLAILVALVTGVFHLSRQFRHYLSASHLRERNRIFTVAIGAAATAIPAVAAIVGTRLTASPETVAYIILGGVTIGSIAAPWIVDRPATYDANDFQLLRKPLAKAFDSPEIHEK